MELYKLEWNWIYVFIIFSFALFVSTVSFDMIANWDNKKTKDTRILLIGSAVFAFGILLLTSDSKLTLLLTIILLTTVLSGLMAVDNRFETSKKPWELYVMAIVSLVTLFGVTIWVYYNTKAGKYIQTKSGQLKEKYQDYKTTQRALKQQRKTTGPTNTYISPLFERQ